jgi:iron complex outermembrane receptor protein
MKKIVLSIIIPVSLLDLHAQTGIDTAAVKNDVYQLGEVVVKKIVDRDVVSSQEMQNHHALDVASSLNLLPSVVFSSIGARNESTVYVRGFDIRSVPVFIDGIPVYVPFDGYVDLARFTTYDISKIDVSKGFSSMMYGANTMGGAINLVGIKPHHRMEIGTKLGIMSGRGYDTRINAGSKVGKFYLQTGFSYLDRDYVPLSAEFEPTSLEEDHKRDNSYRKDIKGSLKMGFMPNNSDEYSVNFIYAHGSKGNPVYLGTDPATSIRYWKWPYWDKRSIYYISKTALGKKEFLRARLYYDAFKNKLSSFDDNNYSTQERGYAFNSYYNDYTIGGNLEFSGSWGMKNTFKFSVHLKNDHHRENNGGEPVRHFADNTYSIAVEDIYNPLTKLTLIPGISYHFRQSLNAEDYNASEGSIAQIPVRNNDALNAQLGIYYSVSDIISANFNIAFKNRFATMKDRYSYRLGRAIPNPDLKSESAINLELGANIAIAEKLSIQPELFYSRLSNTIQQVSHVQEDLSQMQNTGSSAFTGADISLLYRLCNHYRFYVSYSYIDRRNLSNSEILFTGVPENRVLATVEARLIKKLQAILSGEINSGRNNTSDGSRQSPAYTLLDAHLSYLFAGTFRAELGIQNILDKNYTIEEGYPEMGRNFYLALYADFQK